MLVKDYDERAAREEGKHKNASGKDASEGMECRG